MTEDRPRIVFVSSGDPGGGQSGGPGALGWIKIALIGAVALTLAVLLIFVAFWIALFALGAGAAAIPVLRWRRNRRIKALLKTGERTMASVLQKASDDPAGFGAGAGPRHGRAATWLVAYEFQTEQGRPIRAQRAVSEAVWRDLETGMAAEIAYDPANPQLNRFIAELT